MTIFHIKEFFCKEILLSSRRYIYTKKMKISAKLTAVIFAAIAAFASVSCEKSESSIKPEDILGSFTYEGNTYNIRSVVVYPLDNGQTEIWISETAGYTTVEQIEASVGGLVLMVPNRIITQGNKESIDPQRNPIQFIKYDDKTNSGFATLKCILDKENKTIDLEFSSEQLKASANAISGNYKGPYSDYTVPTLNNQWAYNRQAKDITTADYFEMEDGKPSRLILYYKDGKAIELTIPKADVGPEINIQADQPNKYSSTSVTYDNGEEFDIFSGQIQIITDRISKNLKVHIKLSNSAGRTLRADYQGAYRHRFGNKTNRCIYSSGSEGGNGYDGTFLLSSMKVSESNDKVVTFTFTPEKHLDGGQIFATNPTLTVDKSLIGLGEVNTQDISDALSFKYYTFQLDTKHTEAIPGSVINVEKSPDGTYTVNAELAYVSGTVTKYRDMVDENGNVVTEWVEEFDELSGEIIKVEKAKQEEYQEDVITTVDLFYNGQATND